jgi:hypothetical protein
MRKDNNSKTTASQASDEATDVDVDVDAPAALAVSDDNKNVQEEQLVLVGGQFLSGYNYGMKKPAQLYDHSESLLKILLIVI